MILENFSIDENNIIFKRAKSFILETNEYVFLTGRAGSGKTTFLHYIKQNTIKQTAVTASTGVAAVNAGGVTLHSLFQLLPEPYIPETKCKNVANFRKEKLDLIRKLELLIIDEVSMLRADILDSIDTTLKTIRKNNLPFGDLQILFIGDMYQLPPVIKNEEWNILKNYYESPHFFNAKVIKQINLIYLELKKIYRQKDQKFINILNNVRNNSLQKEDIEILNTRYRNNYEIPINKKSVTITTHNNDAYEINNKELNKLNTKKYIIQGQIEKEFDIKSLPTEMEIQLKVGAQVMLIKNDIEKRYYNGKIATVTKIEVEENKTTINVDDKFNISLKLSNTEEEINIKVETWKNIRYSFNKEKNELKEEEIGIFRQLPLRLAWAITIHKSQGLTFDNAVIDIRKSFTTGQTYVALSRCTSLDGIILLSPISNSSIMTDYKAVFFSKTERNEKEQEDLLEIGKKNFWRQQLLKSFDWKPMIIFLYDFEALLIDRKSIYFTDAMKLYERFSKKISEMDFVAVRFKNHLEKIIKDVEKRKETNFLKERCQKAVEYFIENIINDILLPLQNYIETSNIKRHSKKFYNNLIDLESDLILNIRRIMNITYFSENIINVTKIVIPQRSFNNLNSTSMKKKKESTYKLTLELFKQGLTKEQIAKKRAVTISTIETHLIKYLGTEINIEELIDKESFNEIEKQVFPQLQENKISLNKIHESLKGKYDYGQIKIVYNYLKNINKNEY